MIFKDNVIEARFINNEHTTIEVLYTPTEGDEIHSYVLEYDKDSEVFQSLESSGWDLELIIDETVSYKREASRLHNEMIKEAAAEYIKENPPEQIYNHVEVIENIKIVNIIDVLISNNEDEDTLFRAKLAVLELPEAKASINKKVKQDVRKAKSLIELISYITKL